ncbi:MAG: hypothetical protein UY00_C0045G0017, partial [Candidatus Wolfebacteria bacterium GW2011_GWA1_47_6]
MRHIFDVSLHGIFAFEARGGYEHKRKSYINPEIGAPLKPRSGMFSRGGRYDQENRTEESEGDTCARAKRIEGEARKAFEPCTRRNPRIRPCARRAKRDRDRADELPCVAADVAGDKTDNQANPPKGTELSCDD